MKKRNIQLSYAKLEHYWSGISLLVILSDAQLRFLGSGSKNEVFKKDSYIGQKNY